MQYVLRINYNAVVPMVSLEAAAGTGAYILAPIALLLMFYQALPLLLSRLGIPFSLMANGAFPAAFAARPPSTWTMCTMSCSLQVT